MQVYVIKNRVNDLVYVGQTKGRLEYRFKKHIYSSEVRKLNNKFHTAIREIGSDKFFIEHIVWCSNQKELDDKEKEYIKKFNSVEQGYNDQFGGLGGKLTKTTKEYLSEIRLGELNPFYGKKHDKSSKLKMRLKRKNRKPNTKLTDEDLCGVYDMWVKNTPYRVISEVFEISMARISQISKEKNWVKLKTE